MTFQKKNKETAPVELTLEQREAALAEREAALAAKESAFEPLDEQEEFRKKWLEELHQWAKDNDPKNRKAPE